MHKNKPFNPDVDALFLGPKAENQVFFKEMIQYVVDAHMHWRSDFHPDDEAELTVLKQHDPKFRETLYRTEGVLRSLSARLRTHSVPWFSTRYLGHMNADTLMVANIAYVMGMLYNANNVAHEGSPATTGLELEVGRDLCRMFGYEEQRGWGHLTSGGHVANYEGLWVARNVKSMPFAMAAHPKARDLVAGLSAYELASQSVGSLLDSIDELKRRGIFMAVRARSARGRGVDPRRLGKLLVPVSKHYSWAKAADVLGLGQDNIIPVPVDGRCRMDIAAMRHIVLKLIGNKTPVFAAVAVMGSTEEGSVDPAHEMVALRDECEREHGVSFYLHADAAYGGYARALFLDEASRFMPYASLAKRFREEGVLPEDVTWPRKEVYDSFKALAAMDSITVDPHKMGYIPYAAGAVCMKDKRIVDLISYKAAYVFEEAESGDGPPDRGKRRKCGAAPGDDTNVVLGASILEGSKAGATAAAVWAAHQITPLNVTGYGRVIGRGIATARRLYLKLLDAPEFVIGKRRFTVRPVMEPDFNMVNFTFLETGRPTLKAHNELNRRMYALCSYISGRLYENDFMTSSTTLTAEEYGDAPRRFVVERGMPEKDWDRLKSFYMLRASVMTVFLDSGERWESYWQELLAIWRDKLTQIVEEELLARARR